MKIAPTGNKHIPTENKVKYNFLILNFETINPEMTLPRITVSPSILSVAP